MRMAFVSGLIALSFSISAFAADGTSSASAAATTTGQSDSLLNHIAANYSATVHGPAVNQLDHNYAADRNGNYTKSAINLDGGVYALYMFDDRWGVGPDVPFVYAPSSANNAKNFTIGDVGVRFTNKKLIKTNDLTVVGTLILQAPTNSYSISRNMDLGVKFVPNARYNFRGTRFSVGTWTEFKSYLGASFDKGFKAWMAPYVAYRLTSTLSANLLYSYEADHFVGQPGMQFRMYQTDIEPGFVWFITPKVMLNPYLQVFTTKQVSWDHTALGAVVSASL